ncbi:late competence development ComFB family protein [Deltaproteobacteria bacterium TL4]
MKIEDKYKIGNVSVYKIRNRNEVRVVDLMPRVLEEFFEAEPDPLDIEDIYALVLNKLPPRYVQMGSIVLREDVSDHEIIEAVKSAAMTVISNPKH